MSTTIDRRTRTDADVIDVDPATWFAETLPTLHTELAARGVQHFDLPPLAFDIDGFQRTLVVDGDDLVAVEGIAEGAIVLGVDRAQFSDFVQELRTMVAFWTARDARMEGKDDLFLAWDCVWRALTDAWPVHEPGAITFDVDLTRAFTPDDDPAEIAHFLREAGFLHLKGWLDPADMAVISEDIDAASANYSEGDGNSWWAVTEDGTHRLVRLQRFHEQSPTTRALIDSPVWDRLRQVLAAGEELEHRPRDGNCIEALVKPIGVKKGISDVPWHRDCSFGRHTYGCAGTTVGISVTAGREGTGQLRVVAGSHRANVPSTGGISRIQDLPVIPLPTEVGDLTVHLSCTLHEAMPPTLGERKVMYTGFGLPTHDGGVGRKSPLLADLREKAHLLRDQPPAHAR